MIDKISKIIPGGAHTYSKGKDQFPSNAPQLLSRGKGAYVFDDKNNLYLDYGMGLRSVILGYSNDEVNKSSYKEMKNGNNLTRPSKIEFNAAKIFLQNSYHAQMVKFAKNGSNVVTAGIKLARAYTSKKYILICEDHPFFSFDDWFISTTKITRGTLKEIEKYIIKFRYNDIAQIEKLIKKYRNKIACFLLEPSTHVCPKINNNDIDCCSQYPCTRDYKKSNHFLKKLRKISTKEKIILIFDEMITGFRRNIKGAQYSFNVKPDLSTFGKAMANGFSLAALCGKRKIMKLGGIEPKGMDRVFLLSSTHGAEMSALGAFIKNVEICKKNKVQDHIGRYGDELIKQANNISKKMGIENYFYFSGPAYSPIYTCLDKNLKPSLTLRTLFMQEMIKNNVLIPYVSLSYSHKNKELKKTLSAIEASLKVYVKALDTKNIKKYLIGKSIQKVFRRYA